MPDLYNLYKLWYFWLIILIVILFIIWLFFSGGDYHFVDNDWSSEILSQQNNNNNKVNSDQTESNNQIQPLQHTPNQKQSSSSQHEAIKIHSPINSPEIKQCIANNYPPNLGQREKVIVNNQNPTSANGSIIDIIRSTLNTIYARDFAPAQPDFLWYEPVGKNLQLDCYNQQLAIAVVYHDISHYIWPNHTRQSKDEHDKIRAADKFIMEQCQSHNVQLIIIPYNISINLVPGYLKEKLLEVW